MRFMIYSDLHSKPAADVYVSLMVMHWKRMHDQINHASYLLIYTHVIYIHFCLFERMLCPILPHITRLAYVIMHWMRMLRKRNPASYQLISLHT